MYLIFLTSDNICFNLIAINERKIYFFTADLYFYSTKAHSVDYKQKQLSSAVVYFSLIVIFLTELFTDH